MELADTLVNMVKVVKKMGELVRAMMEIGEAMRVYQEEEWQVARWAD